MDDEQRKIENLKRLDAATLAERVKRAGRTKVHGVIPYHSFAVASSECRELFIDGHFYGCISLAQSVGEGIVRFLGDIHQIGAKQDPLKRAERLYKRSVITKNALDAFRRIWGSDRNTFHHLNPDVPTRYRELEERSERCVNALYEIESEVFAFRITDGKLIPTFPQYWPQLDPSHLQVFLRLHDH